MLLADLVLASSSLGDTVTGSLHDDVEVHTVDTDAGIVFDSKIDMFLDTEAEGTGVGEVAHLEFVFLDLESLVEDLFGLGASDGAVARDLFVTSDTEGSDGVSGLGEDGGLASKLFQDLGGSSKSITRLTDTDVQAELVDDHTSHGVG